jgi:putative flippase GtrA
MKPQMRDSMTQPKVAAFITNRKEQNRFIKFAIVGAFGAVVDLIVLNILIRFFGFDALHANPFSVFAAICSNFTLNRYWSFTESQQRPLIPQFFQFLAVNTLGWGLNQLLYWLFLHYLMPFLHIGEPIDYNLAKVMAIGVVLFWNFFINRVTTYRGL